MEQVHFWNVFSQAVNLLFYGLQCIYFLDRSQNCDGLLGKFFLGWMEGLSFWEQKKWTSQIKGNGSVFRHHHQNDIVAAAAAVTADTTENSVKSLAIFNFIVKFPLN